MGRESAVSGRGEVREASGGTTAEAGRTRRVVPRDGVGHRFQNSLVGSDEPRLRSRAAKEGAEKWHRSPPLCLSLTLRRGSVISRQPSHAHSPVSRSGLGERLSLSGLGKRLASVSFSPRAITADRRSIVVDIAVWWKRGRGLERVPFFSSPSSRVPQDLGWPISLPPGGQLNAREPDRPLRGRKPRNTPTSWPT